MTTSRKREVLVALAALVLLPWLGQTREVASHEGLYGWLARDVAGGHAFAPRIGERPYRNKPPVFFWAAAACGAVRGEVDLVAARLPSVAAGFASVLALAALGRRLATERAGFIAGALLLATPVAVHAGRSARLDAMLSALVLLADLAWTERAAWGGALAGALLGVAVLVKGPVALALFAVFAAVTWRTGHVPFRGGALLGLAAGLVLVLGAFVAAAGMDQVRALALQPDVVTGVDQHERSPVYYLGVLPAGLGAVAPLVLIALPGVRRDPALAVALVALAFLSCVPGKRAHYLVPLHPFTALAAGALVDRGLDGRATPREERLLAIWARVVPWLIGVSAVALGAFAVARDAWLLPWAVVLLAVPLVLRLVAIRPVARACAATVLATAVGVLGYHARGAEHVVPRSDAPALGAALRALPRDVPLALAFEGDPEATFFGDRPYRSFQGRFEEELPAWLAAHPDAALVLPPGRLPELPRARVEELARGQVRKRLLLLVRVRRE